MVKVRARSRCRTGSIWIAIAPPPRRPEPRRLLFIGSFAHKPNVMAIEFFVNEVFPNLQDVTLHIIAGSHHERSRWLRI